MGGSVSGSTWRERIGRIIELRTHYFNHTKLVPEMAMRQWVEPVSQGALHVLNNGVVVGIRDRSSVHAFDVASGTRIGEWRLPDKKVHWAHLCGGGQSLFILGHDEKTLDARPVSQSLLVCVKGSSASRCRRKFRHLSQVSR